jgi:hypothetical protein
MNNDEHKITERLDRTPAATPSRPMVALLLILVVTLGTRLYMVAHAQNVALDATTHLSMGKMLFSHQPAGVLRDFKYHPGYAFTVGAIATVSGASWPDGWIVVGHIVSIFAGLVAVVAFYYVATKIFDRTVALAATMLLAISPAFTQTSADVLSDAPALAMALVAIAAGFKAMEQCSAGRWSSVAYAAAVGLFGGLGYLFRPEHLLASAIATFLIIVAVRPKGKLPVMQLAGVVTVVAATAAVVLPYALTIGALTQKKSVDDFAMGSGTPMLASIVPSPTSLSAIRLGDLWCSPLGVILKLQGSMGPIAFGLACACLLTWIAAYMLSRRGRPLPQAMVIKPMWPGAFAMFAPSVVLGPVLLLLEYHQRGYVSARHLMLPGTLLMPMAGAGAVMFAKLAMATFRGARGQSLEDRLEHQSTSGLSFALFLLILAALSVAARSMATLHRDKGCYQQVGVQMAKAFGAGHYVLSPDGWIPFFAQCPPEEFSNAEPMRFNLGPQQLSTPDALYHRCCGLGKYDYVVAGEDQLRRYASASNPQDRTAADKAIETLKHLADDPRFTLVKKFTFSKETIWLFKVN